MEAEEENTLILRADTRPIMTFRSDIEGLRAIAILLVVLFHCGLPGFSGGFVGVDVFFVLSGFLITGMLVNEIQRTSKLDLLEFYARRVRRLLPAFALVLVATLLVGAILLSPGELNLAGYAGRAAALYMSNMFFDKNARGYFDQDVEFNPLLHTWSLAVEEQFYVFWPVLILVTLRWGRSMRALIAVLCVVTIISLGVGLWFTTHHGTFAFYELPARAWEFGVGGLAVLLSRGRLKIQVGWWSALSWIGLFAILGTGFLYSRMEGVSFPGWLALLPTVGTTVVLLAGTEYPNRGAGIVLATPVLQLLGRLSYSWYLWHWPVLVFAAVLIPTISVAGKVVAAALALLVAGLSYHVVERPIRFHPALLTRPVWSVGLAGAVTLCSLGISWLSIGIAAEMAKGPKDRAITAAKRDITKLWSYHECVSPAESAEVKVCHFGKETTDIHIVLFGDSHAVDWFTPLQRMAEATGWTLTTVVKLGCPAFDIGPTTTGPRQLGEIGEITDACARWRPEALRRIVTMHPTHVFLGNAISHLGLNNHDYLETPSLEELQDGTRRTLEALTNLHVIIIRDVPHFPYDVPACLARSLHSILQLDHACEAPMSDVINPAVLNAVDTGAHGMSQVNVIDLTDSFCEMDTCKPILGDIVMYRDHDHLTATFADRLASILSAKLQAVVNVSD